MKKIKTILPLLGLITTSAFAQGASNLSRDIEVKAKIIPGCFLSADNINFGTLVTPITNQSALSNMRVLCSKAASLNIEIVYGASSGSGETNGTFTAVLKSSSTSNHYKINKDGSPYTNSSYDIGCSYGDGIYFYSKQIADLYGVNYIAGAWIADKWNICSGNNINTATLAAVGIPSQGTLVGIAKGEKVSFSLENPSNSTKVWNSTNKYLIVATGIEQSIPMKANIKSSENPTYRMTPDTYQSILTVVLTY